MQYKFVLRGLTESGDWKILDDFEHDDIYSRKDLTEFVNKISREIYKSMTHHQPFNFGRSIFDFGAFKAYKVDYYDLD